MSVPKDPLIFISHSSKNKEQVKLLADLLKSMNLVPGKHVFCSSLPGYDIPIDTNNRIFDFLRDCYLHYKIHVIFIHSQEYYKSAVCLNEMGAAWVLKSNYTSILLPGFNFSEMKGVINGDSISIKLDNSILEVKNKLNQLRKQITEEFNLLPIPDINWEESRDLYIERVNSLPLPDSSVKQVGKSKDEISVSEDNPTAVLIQLLVEYYKQTVNFRETLRHSDIELINKASQKLESNARKISYFYEINRIQEKELAELASEFYSLFEEYSRDVKWWKQSFPKKNEIEIQNHTEGSFKKVLDKCIESINKLGGRVPYSF